MAPMPTVPTQDLTTQQQPILNQDMEDIEPANAESPTPVSTVPPTQQAPRSSASGQCRSTDTQQTSGHLYPQVRPMHEAKESGPHSLGSTRGPRQKGGQTNSCHTICHPEGIGRPHCLCGLMQPRYPLLGSSDESSRQRQIHRGARYRAGRPQKDGQL